MSSKVVNYFKNKKIKPKKIENPLYSSEGSNVGEQWTDYFSEEEVREIKAEQNKN